ncbi:ATP-binding protein, partial [bacterium]|nr:ATP-binding protein [bacterium]
DNIWISHNAGITRIDKSRQNSVSFDVTAGLQAREFNQGAAHVGTDGSLFFGGQFGFNVIEPSISYDDSFEPKLQVTSFKLLNEHMYFDAPYSELQQINLDYDYQFASIDFAALDYRRPSAVKYRYRIDGIHNEWINLDQTRSVSISGLGFGNYKLRLSATNVSGVWLGSDREIALNIAPPWWLTWYAYSAYATIIVYFIFFVFKQQQAKAKRELARRLELEERVEERTRDLKQARNDAEAAARAKSEFLAAMSHEIRTPMHGMIGMTDLLIESGLNAKQKSYALTAKDSGESLLAIINSILDYSKMEAEKLELDVTEFDIVTLIDNVSALLTQNALEHQTQLHIVWLDCAARKVTGDAGKVRQILINLIGNAIKFSKGGIVVVWCSTERSVAAAACSDNAITCRICVEDNGIGIAEDKLESIFEVFTQADTSTTRQYGGTGLGLSISKELAALMGGSLTASSQLGRGSKFTFETEIFALEHHALESSNDSNEVLCASVNETLFNSIRSKLLIAGFTVQRLGVVESLGQLKKMPCKVIIEQSIWEKLASQDDGRVTNLIVLSENNESHPTRSNIQFVNPPFTQSDLLTSIDWDFADDLDTTQSTLKQTATLKSQSISIMVVEDVLVNQQIAMTMLNSLGASVDLACNGEEAVELFQSKSYDLIFMDCQMPVLDGYQATAKIREIERQTQAARTTVIALTAGGDQNDKQRAHDAGMDGFLTKPFTTSDLKQALNELALTPKEEKITNEQEARHAEVYATFTQDDVLDVDVLGNLKSLNRESGGQLIPKLMSGFSTQFAQKLSELRSSIELEDTEALRTTAHAIKSMSANMGAKSIRAAAETLEHGYLEFDFSRSSHVVTELQVQCEIYISAAETFFRQ